MALIRLLEGRLWDSEESEEAYLAIPQSVLESIKEVF